MKKSKKSRVSWPPNPMLCQVKLFLSEDCPAKVASQPQSLNNPKQSSRKPPAPDLPPGFEGNHYATKQKLSDIPRIKWKRPAKFILSASWLVGSGDKSTERQTENLRIAKVLEAIYPHRSAIPPRSSVSPDVQGGCYDDSKTPIIRLTPIEDEWEAADKSSQTPILSDITVNRQSQLESEPHSSNQEPCPASVSGFGGDVSLAASAVLTALMKSEEERSMIDPDLLVKFLSDPKIVQNLIGNTRGKPPEGENPPVDANITPRLVSQPAPVSAAMDRNPPPIPLKQTFAVSQPYSYPETTRVLPPRSANGNPHVGSMSVQDVGIEPPQPAQLAQKPPPAFGAFPISLQRPQPAFSTVPMNPNPKELLPEGNPVVKSQPQSQSHSQFRVQASVGPGTGPGLKPGPQLGFNGCRMEVPGRPIPGVQPVKSVDYFKNLIREHGTDKPGNHETNQNQSQTRIYQGRINNNKVEAKVRKQCMYFGSTRGCKLGDSCMFLHDGSGRWRTNAPIAKRTKFGT